VEEVTVVVVATDVVDVGAGVILNAPEELLVRAAVGVCVTVIVDVGILHCPRFLVAVFVYGVAVL